MFTQKNKIIWFVNLILFIGVVFVGIEQAGKGAEVAKFEKEFEFAVSNRQKLSDQMYSDEKILDNFVKPTIVYYFDVEKVTANLPVR